MAQDRRISDPDFVEQLRDIPAAGDRVRLTALNQAATIFTAKERRLRRERAIKAARLGRDAPEVQDLQARVDQQHRERILVQAESQRCAVPVPERQSNRFILHGRVVDSEGLGQSGLTVAAVNRQGQAATFDCTNNQGYFKLDIDARTDKQGPEEVFLQISDQQQRRLYRSDESWARTPGQLVYREIVLGESTQEPCPPPPA